MKIPATDREKARAVYDAGERWALYKEAGPGWPSGGFLFLSRSGKGAHRRTKFFTNEQEAKRALEKFVEL